MNPHILLLTGLLEIALLIVALVAPKGRGKPQSARQVRCPRRSSPAQSGALRGAHAAR